jgi:hypothetical protein
VIVDAMKRANSIEAPEVLIAMASTDLVAKVGYIAFEDKGDLKEGAITLYNYRNDGNFAGVKSNDGMYSQTVPTYPTVPFSHPLLMCR